MPGQDHTGLVQEFFNDIDNFENDIGLLCHAEKSTEEVYALGHLLVC